MAKRAQITLFIILGMLLLSSAALFYLLKEKLPVEEITVAEAPLNIKPVSVYLQECFDEVAKDGLLLLSAEGGNFILEVKLDRVNIPIRNYMEENKNTMPTIQELEEDFSNYMINIISGCLLNISEQYRIKTSPPKVKTTFSDKAYIKIYYPIKLIKGDEISEINTFNLDYNINLKLLHDIASEIVENTIEEPDWIDYMQLGKYPVEINIHPYSSHYFIYTLVDHNSSLDYEPYSLTFGVPYKKEIYEPIEPNSPPVFLDITDQTARAGEEFYYDIDGIDPDNDELTYTVETDLFDIDPEYGVIRFIPEEQDVGEHYIAVIVDDGKGLWEKQTFKLTIED